MNNSLINIDGIAMTGQQLEMVVTALRTAQDWSEKNGRAANAEQYRMLAGCFLNIAQREGVMV